MDSRGRVLCGGRLLQADGAECHQQFVVYGPGIIEEGANNTLDAFDASSIQGWAGVLMWEVLFMCHRSFHDVNVVHVVVCMAGDGCI